MKRSVAPRLVEMEPVEIEGDWLHGIPTAEDVVDPEYREQRRIEKLNAVIYGAASSLTSTVRLHNRTATALRRFGKDVMKTEHFLKKGGMDTRVVELVDPDFVYKNAKTRFEKFVALVGGLGEKSRLLDHWRIPTTVTSNVKMVFESGLISQGETGGSFSYTYIPAEVLVGIIGKMRSQLDLISDMVGEAKLLAVYSLFERLDDDSSFRLVGGDLEYRTGQSCFGMELREGSEAWEGSRQNGEIAEKSDVYVRFDAKYVIIKTLAGEWHISLDSMFGDSETVERYVLFQRIMARDMLSELASRRGEVIVNGRKLRGIHRGWRYEGRGVPIWLVNVLGESVESETGRVEPEDWVVFERELVAEYRRLPQRELLVERGTAWVIRDLLERYHDGDEEDQLLTFHDKLERLVYSLRRSEYDRVCRR